MCSDRVPITVVRVNSLEWAVYNLSSSNLPLDGCPNNGGRRIFPDLLSPTDEAHAAARRTVDLVATLDRPIKDVTVHFKVWDVDDPFDQLNAAMPNVTAIDANTTGPDNRLAAEAAVTLTAVSNKLGKATVSVHGFDAAGEQLPGRGPQ